MLAEPTKEYVITILSFPLAAIPPSALGVAFTPFSYQYDASDLFDIFLHEYPFSLFFVITLGVPMYMLFRRRRMMRSWAIILIGLGFGTIAGTIMGSADILSSTLGAIDGVLAASIFWLTWRWGHQHPSLAHNLPT